MASSAERGGGSTASQAFTPPPDDLKALAPFLQRAHETRKADAALSYWCNYHAAQLGISLLSSLSASSKVFLMSLMDTLEAQKKSLAGNDIVHGDDMVAKAHIENVALKVFFGADNEDRSGKASKATARHFLVACNFIELLTNFGKLDQEMEEKLKYAKWKAADIARAFREGRKPTPGPAGSEDVEGLGDLEGQGDDTTVTGLQAASSRMAGLSETGPLPSKEELDAEMAKLSARDGELNLADGAGPVAISPNVEPPTPERREVDAGSVRRRAESRLSFDGRGGLDGLAELAKASPSAASGSPNFSMPLRLSRQGSQTSEEHVKQPQRNEEANGTPGETQSAFFQYSQGRVPSGTTSPSARPLPQPPGQHAGRGNLPIPPGGQGTTSPLLPPSTLSPAMTPAVQHQASFSPYHAVNALQPSVPPGPSASSTLPSAPSAPEAASSLAQAKLTAPAPAVDPSTFPSTLDLTQSARVQKLAKWAVSALDYEDLETARRQLREALDICEGRAPVPKNKS